MMILKHVLIFFYPRRLINLLLLVFSLVLPALWSETFAQSNLQFEHVSAKYPLSNDAVYAITQDHHGFIWIGTEDGLNRFDGNEMVVFRHDPADPGSISVNWLPNLHEDQDGQIWIGHDKGIDRLDLATGQFKAIHDFRLGDTIINLDFVHKFYEPSEGGMWLGGDQIMYVDPTGREFTLYPVAVASKQPEVQFLGSDDQGWLLAGTLNGMYQMKPGGKEFRPYAGAAPLANLGVRGGHVDRNNRLWLVGLNDLFRLNMQDQKLDTVASGLFSEIGYLEARDIVEEANGRIWLGGTNKGLLRVDPGLDRIDTYQHDPEYETSITSNIGTSLLVDRHGNLWIGGVNGLDRLPGRFLNRSDDAADSPQFHHLQVVPEAVTNPDQQMVRCFLKDKRGNFWIGTYDGLYKYRQNGRELELIDHVTHDPSDPGTLSGKDIRVLLEDQRGDIWVSTRRGLNRIDGQTGAIERLYFENYELNGLTEEVFWALCEDDQGFIWIGTEKSGLLRLDPVTRETRRYLYNPEGASYSENPVVEIYQDGKGHVWVGTYGGGLNLYEPEADALINFMTGEAVAIAGDVVWTIFEDAQDRLWIGTENGLNQLITENNNGTISYRSEHYSEQDGLGHNTVYGMMQDTLGRLWISALSGISCFDPAAGTFLNFGPEDDLPINSFTPDAHFVDPQTGDLFLGGVNGYLRFQPTAFRADTVAPPVVISSLTRFNKRENDGQPIIDYFVAGKTSFRFSHLDNIIIFNLALLNFEQSEKNEYAYRLEGLHDHWVPLGTDRKITLTGLNAGEYTLRIRGVNHHGIATKQETKVTFTITPPWWWTTLAKIIYMVLGLMAVLGVYRYELRKRLVEQEAHQLKELDAVKSRFFTNISHEFRTPLTIISGMATQVRKDPHQWLEKGMELIQGNSNQLLSLINQILDLRKLESGNLQIKLVRGNIIPYLHYLVDSFGQVAQSKGIRIHFLAATPELEMDYDPDKMLWILSNLLSNAIKYTSEPGDIYIQVDAPVVDGQEQLSIRVQDSGQGIHPDALPYIFDRFYQVEDLASQKRQGSGVGLALVKELVQLLRGTIEATSKLGVGTTFTLHFPISREAPLQDGKFEPVVVTGTSPVDNIPLNQANSPAAPESVSNRVSISVSKAENQSEQPTLLIVEDNADVRLYLSACLGGNYQLLLAENGQEGIDRAIEQVPDLIVSDVMMPVKDGFALCDTLKNDTRTSHIPIVLLTARADFESRIKGLHRGADAYLAKPFEQEELLLTLQNLLQARQKLQQKLAEFYVDRTAPADPVDTETDIYEDAFLQQLEGIIMEHIGDPDLSPELICREMGMSNTNLYRKLKALTDLSLTFFIRRIRLREAKSLLLNSDMNVTEVAYAVGFSDPKYFSRIFSEVFEQSPSQFRKG